MVGMPKEGMADGRPTAINLPEGWTAGNQRLRIPLSGERIVGRSFTMK